MKQLLVLAMTALILSCQPQTTATEDPGDDAMAKFEKNVETTKMSIEAFIAKDIDKMISYSSDDFRWSPPQYGMDSLSRDVWIQVVTGFMKDYNDITFENPLYFAGLGEDQKPSGDVRVYGTWKSTHVPTGKPVGMKWYAVYQFNEEGKVNAQLEWYNAADLTPAEE